MSEMREASGIPRLLCQPAKWWAGAAALAIICIAVFLVRTWFGATRTHLLQQSGWSVYSLKDTNRLGGQVTGLAAGLDGRLWAGTMSGVYVFDGQTWKPYQVSEFSLFRPESLESSVCSLAVDSENRVWFATLVGLRVITDGQIQAVDLPGDESEAGLDIVCDHIIFGPDDRMGIRTQRGISVYDGEQWQRYAVSDFFVDATAFDPQGRVWVAGSIPNNPCCALAAFDSPDWTQYQIPFPGPDNAEVSAFAFDAQGRLWVTFSRGHEDVNLGLGMRDGQNWVFYQTADAVDPLAGRDGSSSALVMDQTGRLWVGVGPVLVALDIQSDLPAADPVPDTTLNGRRFSHWLAWGSGVLAAIVSLIAGWATFLHSKWSQRWARRLQKRAIARLVDKKPLSLDTQDTTASQRPVPRIRSCLAPTLAGLAGGILSVAWIVLCYFFCLGSTSNFGDQPDLKELGLLLAYFGWVGLILGAGVGLLLYYGIRGICRRRAPTQLVVGILGLLLGISMWAVTWLALLFLFVMFATG